MGHFMVGSKYSYIFAFARRHVLVFLAVYFMICISCNRPRYETVTMDGNTFYLENRGDKCETLTISETGTTGKICNRPIKINGKKIYESSEITAEPKMMDTGKKIANEVTAFIRRRLHSEFGAGEFRNTELALSDIVINENGKVVYFMPAAINKTTARIDHGNFASRYETLIGSVMPKILSITFEPVKVNGENVPYLIMDINGLP